MEGTILSKTNWTFNGLVVQDINNISNDSKGQISYQGLGCFSSWPLDDRVDTESELISEEARKRWFDFYYDKNINNKFALAVVPSIDYIQRYLILCNKYHLNIRVLHIESDRNKPIWDGPALNKVFLGYDYVTSQSFYSTVFDDLFGSQIPPMLVYFRSMLNKYGLFKTEDELNLYIKKRNTAIEEGYNLESFGDFCKVKISLITDKIV